jgi:hypothetical protein
MDEADQSIGRESLRANGTNGIFAAAPIKLLGAFRF